MDAPCTGWCGQKAPSAKQNRCSACSVLEKPFFSLDPSQSPTSEQRKAVSRKIDSVRGLSSEQMMLRLADSFNESSLPPGFKAYRGSPGILYRHIAGQWDHAKFQYSLRGRMPHGIYQLPDSDGRSFLCVGDDGSISIDDIDLTGPRPMADICDWLSNPNRLRSVRSWKKLLIAMSNCCISMPLNIKQEEWPQHLMTRGWDGIDAPDPSITMQFPGTKLHPFLNTIAMISGREPCTQVSPGYIARTSPNLISEFGGDAAAEWSEIIRRGDKEEFHRIHSITVHPRLVVDENSRLRMVVLRSGVPTTVPIPTNAKIWRCLIHSQLFPEGSEGVNIAKHLFWVWESEEAEWTPSLPQMKSSRMLREAIDSLGKNSSIEPIYSISEFSDEPGICVVGTSGIAYHVRGITDGRKFLVVAFPSKSHLSDPECTGIYLCIDSQMVGGLHLPAGDICSSYILALRHDTTSRNHIFTLNHLLDVCEFVNENSCADNLDDWWKEVTLYFENYDPNADDEEWEPEIPEGAPGPEIMLEEMEAEAVETIPSDALQDPFLPALWEIRLEEPLDQSQGGVEES